MMMRFHRSWVLLGLLVAGGCKTHVRAPRSPEAQADIAEARAAFEAKDAAIGRYFSDAYGYALFPHVGKGGLIVGGGGGSGYVFERGQLIGTTTMTQLSAGAQIGGQGFRQVIFFEERRNLANFKDENFELGAEVNAVALDAGAAQHAKYEKGVLIFTVPIGGLMAEATVKGQKFRYTPLPAEPPPAACAKCQAPVASGAKSCGQCGAKL
jgi:lipid-binding SYLF domain-containing protein